MFGSPSVGAGLSPGEDHGIQVDETVDVWGDVDFEALISRVTAEAVLSDSGDGDRDVLPDLGGLPVGPFLGVVLEYVDRSRLNGFDLVEVLKARERMVSHLQAGVSADMVEIAYAAPGDADSSVARLVEAFEYAADEIRAALALTRRAAEYRLDFAFELVERLPRVAGMLAAGGIDLARARVFTDGTAHVPEETARKVVDVLAGEAGRLTTGQLRARIRRLCIQADPEDARSRYEHAVEQRRLVIEPSADGTAHLYLFDIGIDTARAIGRTVNRHLVSLRRNDGRSHDQLRADIAVDLLLGRIDPTRGAGTVDIRVDLTTLAGLDQKAGEIPGMGPVIADIARKVADHNHRGEWRVAVTDDQGQIIDIVTTSRRPSKTLSRYLQTLQPVCSFPGCRTPAANCDYDHLTPWSHGGPTSVANGGPKCRHDHILKDHGWTHQRINRQDHWTSPLGHTYITQGQSP